MRRRADSDKKLRELVLYVAKRCEGDPSFGAVKLNKILFYADFSAYAQTGRSITGAEYQKLAWGPAPRRLLPALKELEKAKDCARDRKRYHGLPQDRVVALRDPDLSEFTAEEIAAVDEVIEAFWGRSGRDVSELSHLFGGWEIAEEGETIPYEAVFLAPDEELSQRARARGREIAARLAQAANATP